jgi:transposase-like protein
VAIVWPCRLDVESYVAAGRGVAVPRPRCPACQRRLIFWWWYERFVRSGGCHRIWVRRVKCPACEVTHALLPAFLLRRRLDPVDAIGVGLARMIAGGVGARPVAEALGVPHGTARSWRRRHRARAPALAAGFAALVVALGGGAVALAVDVERAALEAAVAAWHQATRRRTAPAITGTWQFVGVVTGGGWLGTTTSPPWAVLGPGHFMPPVPQTPTEEGPGDP